MENFDIAKYILEGKLGKALNEDEGGDYDVLTGGLPHKVEVFVDEETGYEYERITITEPIPDGPKSSLVKKFRYAGWHANPNMAGGITAIRQTGKVVDVDDLEENSPKSQMYDNGWMDDEEDMYDSEGAGLIRQGVEMLLKANHSAADIAQLVRDIVGNKRNF